MAKYISTEIAKKALADSNLIPRYAENCKPITDIIIDSLTAADVVPVRHGWWIEYPVAHYYKCSECRYTVPYKKATLVSGKRQYNYCPKCGAKMDEEE